MKNFKWPPWQPSWISQRNDFNNSESLGHCEASHQVLAQSDMVWEMPFEEFQDGCHGGQLGYQNGMILAILNLFVIAMPQVLVLSDLWFGRIECDGNKIQQVRSH